MRNASVSFTDLEQAIKHCSDKAGFGLEIAPIEQSTLVGQFRCQKKKTFRIGRYYIHSPVPALHPVHKTVHVNYSVTNVVTQTLWGNFGKVDRWLNIPLINLQHNEMILL